MSFIGVWGKADTTVPPIPTAHQGSGSHPDRTFDTAYGGWYYSSAASTTTLWAVNNGCIDSAGSAVTFAEVEAWGIESASDLECTRYLHCPAGVDVVGCLHSGGHDTGDEGRTIMLAFMKSHKKVSAGCQQESCEMRKGRRLIIDE